MTRVLRESDIERVPFRVILEAVREFVLADFRGETVAPPRHLVDFSDGHLVFTSGGMRRYAGFRAYETFSTSELAHEDQIVAVWDRETRKLSGIAIGDCLGALRTGALGGVAIDRMAAARAEKLAIIGTGLQAETQLIAAHSVRDFSETVVFSRSAAARQAFCERMSGRLGKTVQSTTSAQEAAEGADVVVLATNSANPVIEVAWLKPGAHVNTVGPKTKTAHELPLELIELATHLATDSPQQISAMGEGHMLSGSDSASRIRHLGNPASVHNGKVGVSLFLSAGLAGTEVAALKAALDWLEGEGG